MRRLLRANFARLLKNKLFWILTCAELFLGALFPILHYMDNIDENSGWNMDSTIFIYALFVPLMVSLLTALFIGTDYSDGTMRNKLIAGHVRRKIYVANLISMLMYGREAQSKTKTASPATIPKSGERNRKIHSCVLYLISI